MAESSDRLSWVYIQVWQERPFSFVHRLLLSTPLPSTSSRSETGLSIYRQEPLECDNEIDASDASAANRRGSGSSSAELRADKAYERRRTSP